MKKFVFIYSLLMLLSLEVYSNTTSRIAINVYVPENSSLPQNCREYLSDRVSYLLSENNVLSKNYSDRFYLTAKIHIVEKNIIEGLPQRVSQKIEVTYKIGDAVDNIIYSTLSKTYIGIGTTEMKSLLNAFSQIKQNDSYSQFVEKAKNRIIDYYAQRCESIIQESDLDTQNKEFDKALYKLSLVPYGVDCFDEVLNHMKTIYSEKISHENYTLLLQAKQEWISNPNKEGANTAISYLKQMNPNKENQQEIDKLLTEIDKKLQEDEKKEWEFMLKQYEHEQALKIQKEQNEASLLNTCIQLGFNFLSSNLQPVNIIENLLLW